MGVDNLGHFSDDSSCGKDNGFVLSWSPIKVDPGELVWEENNFEKLGREDWFLQFHASQIISENCFHISI